MQCQTAAIIVHCLTYMELSSSCSFILLSDCSIQTACRACTTFRWRIEPTTKQCLSPFLEVERIHTTPTLRSPQPLVPLF